MRRADRLILCTALLLFIAATLRDGLDRWIAATTLPPLISETSVETRDREDRLLRVYTVADGRWRLAARPDRVDPDFLAMLIAYEDRRFYDHAGVDPRAVLRAAGQALAHGQVMSGASTLTMQVARLLDLLAATPDVDAYGLMASTSAPSLASRFGMMNETAP